VPLAGLLGLPILHEVAEETRLIVSEPPGDLAGAWNEVPDSSYGLVHHGRDELHPFHASSCWVIERTQQWQPDPAWNACPEGRRKPNQRV
jgi:hypothetical protein